MIAPIVHVVDDDSGFRTAVSRLLQAKGYRVSLYESASVVLENLPADEPGCILLDVLMAGLDGLDLQDRLSEQQCTLPIVFLTGHGDIEKTVRAIKGGAEDFLQKPISKDKLFQAVDRALLRYRKTQERSNALKIFRGLVATLTPREREVFHLIIRGKLNKQVAYELGTAERTIKAHRHSVMLKLKVRSLAEAVSMAERLGMLTADSSAAKA